MENNNCDNNCAYCGVEDCPSRSKIEKYKPHPLSSFKKTIAVVSGKGGVGKSLVSELLAVSLRKKGHSVALLDADITGPSVPRAFGLQNEKAAGDESGIFAVKSKSGILTMSAAYLLENEADPVIWRGPMIAGLLGSFYKETIYDECEYLVIDMPPGTGDVPLTVFQSIPVDGILIVASPQELVSVIVEKAVNMAKMMDIKIYGLVENMGYATCPDCGKQYEIFGPSKAAELAKEYDIPAVARLPIDPAVARLADTGRITEANTDALADVFLSIEKARGIEDFGKQN